MPHSQIAEQTNSQDTVSFSFHRMFFFDSSGELRDLHSFPTRRSSDLLGAERHLDGAGQLADAALEGLGKLRSEEHTSELQSLTNLVCPLLLEKKKIRLRLKPNTLTESQAPCCATLKMTTRTRAVADRE